MLASETQNADYLQGDDARWNHKEIERLRGYTMYINIYIYLFIYTYICMYIYAGNGRQSEIV